MKRVQIALALAAFAAGAGIAALMVTNEVRPSSGPEIALLLTSAWSFVAAGIVAQRYRPGSPIATALVATGFTRLAAGLAWSQVPVIFTVGRALEFAYLVGVAYVVLSFPDGRLRTSSARLLLTGAALAAVPFELARLSIGGHHQAETCTGCPPIAIEAVDAPQLAHAVEWVQLLSGSFVALATVAVLVARWRRASPRLRFVLAPVLWTGAAIFAVVLALVDSRSGFTAMLGNPLGRAPELLLDAALAALALGFLAGLLRDRLARSSVADLVVDLQERGAAADISSALARALRDPSLDVAYWLPDAERFVDAAGRTVDLPTDPGRSVTFVRRDTRTIAALVHDPALLGDEELLESVSAAAALALENERLQAELRARLEELRASRARLVEAAEAERRRIERDLHDGTQQRLVAIAMTLGLADSKLGDTPDARAIVREAKSDVAVALAELRELSQGIHPGVLAERGLRAAVTELAYRARVPTELELSLPERLPEQAEAGAYYVVSEALTNVAKHAGATAVRISVTCARGNVAVEVADDGAGGADAARGSGLRGLRDRVEALGGSFALASPRGRGTIVQAEIPCE